MNDHRSIILGFLHGPGNFKLSHNAPQIENVRVSKLTVRSLNAQPVYVGRAGMNLDTGEGVLQKLSSVGESFHVTGGGKSVTIGDFGVQMPVGGSTIIVTAKVD